MEQELEREGQEETCVEQAGQVAEEQHLCTSVHGGSPETGCRGGTCRRGYRVLGVIQDSGHGPGGGVRL